MVFGIMELYLTVYRDVLQQITYFVLSCDFKTRKASILSFFNLFRFSILTSQIQEKILSESVFKWSRDRALLARSAISIKNSFVSEVSPFTCFSPRQM
jgi:hypothetical protein